MVYIFICRPDFVKEPEKCDIDCTLTHKCQHGSSVTKTGIFSFVTEWLDMHQEWVGCGGDNPAVFQSKVSFRIRL